MPEPETRPSRQQILVNLKQQGEATAGELALALGLTPVTIRHHLSLLEREGLVRPPEIRRKAGRGRPEKVYCLTTAAQAQLPRNDPDLLTHLVAALSQSLDEDGLRSLLAEAGRHYAAAVGGGWPVSAPSRRALTYRFLEARGYLPRWESTEGEAQLHFGHCPYSPLAQAQPNLCAFDEALLARLLGRRIRITRRIALFEPDCTLLVGRGAAFDSLLAF